MIIFDEVHLIGESAKSFSQIFDVVVEDRKKAILGLTATIDENDSNFNTILSVLPPVRKYQVKEAVRDGRLARPVILPIKVNLTEVERRIYYDCSSRITTILAGLIGLMPNQSLCYYEKEALQHLWQKLGLQM